MQSQYRELNGKSVNGNRSDIPTVASLGRTRYVQQVASDRNPATVCKPNNKLKNSNKLKISTWNVNTLYQAGKLANVEREMRRLRVDVMGLCEVRWVGAGMVDLSDGGCIIYSCGEEHKYRVGVMLSNQVTKCLAGFYAISERVLLVRIKGKPFDVCIIQVYAPTCDHSEEAVVEFYCDIMKAKQQCKPHDVTLVMGDLNAKLGQGREGDMVGPYGLGERNERGDTWAEWCEENEQVVLNTWFRQPPRRLWTWMSPGDRYRNQIDYITINRRFRRAVTKARTYPGADCNTDHTLLSVDVRVTLKKPKKKQSKPKINIKILEDKEIQNIYSVSVRNKYKALRDHSVEDVVNAEQQFENFKISIEESNRSLLPKAVRRAKKTWMTDVILELMDERRKCKGKDKQKYEILNKKYTRIALQQKKDGWMKCVRKLKT